MNEIGSKTPKIHKKMSVNGVVGLLDADNSDSHASSKILSAKDVLEGVKKHMVDINKSDKNDDNGKEKEVISVSAVLERIDGEGTQDFQKQPAAPIKDAKQHDLQPSKEIVIIDAVAMAIDTNACNSVNDNGVKQAPIGKEALAVSILDGGDAIPNMTYKAIVTEIRSDTSVKIPSHLDLESRSKNNCLVADAVEATNVDQLLPHQSVRSYKRFALDDDIDDIDEDPVSKPATKKQKINSTPAVTMESTLSLVTSSLPSNVKFQQKFIPSDDSFKSPSSKKVPSLVDINTPIAKHYDNMSASKKPVISSSSIANETPNTTKSITPATLPMLCTVTDEMFVLETASLVVPYVYERPPIKNLKDIVEKIGVDLVDQKSRKLEEEAVNLKMRKKLADDDSWEESSNASDTSTSTNTTGDDQENGITETNTANAMNPVLATSDTKIYNYFERPLGKFFMDIGVSLVQQHVYTALLRHQKHTFAGANYEIRKNLERIKMNNTNFKLKTLSCKNCNFKSESALSIANHNETPHHFGRTYWCNFCLFKTRKLTEVTTHMDVIHNVKARLEKALSQNHQCPYCPYENHTKARLDHHVLDCAVQFRPETNQIPPLYWEPPARNSLISSLPPLVETDTTANQVIPLLT